MENERQRCGGTDEEPQHKNKFLRLQDGGWEAALLGGTNEEAQHKKKNTL
jgi:hypothetical protein